MSAYIGTALRFRGRREFTFSALRRQGFHRHGRPLLPFSVNCMLQCRVAKPAAHVRRSDPCCSMSLMQKNLPFITAEAGSNSTAQFIEAGFEPRL
ncbi:MAG: hypothetical protein ACRCT9_13960 [Roseinatronobacter monicus]